MTPTKHSLGDYLAQTRTQEHSACTQRDWLGSEISVLMLTRLRMHSVTKFSYKDLKKYFRRLDKEKWIPAAPTHFSGPPLGLNSGPQHCGAIPKFRSRTRQLPNPLGRRGSRRGIPIISPTGSIGQNWHSQHGAGNAYYMAGAGGQSTIIVPSHNLVVVRLGHYKGAASAREGLNNALILLMEAVPESD